MANSSVRYVASGDTQEFAVTFPFISRTHVTVEVDGTAATFTWNNDSLITITSPADITADQVVLIKRTTSQNTRLVDYVDGSNLSETDLDTDSKQAFYMAQEALDELTLLDDAAVASTAGDLLISDGTDFVNKTMSGDATINSAGALTIANTSVETAMLASDAVTGDKIADDTIDSEHYIAGSIDTEHIATGQVTTAKLADDAVTGAKIALFDDSYAATDGHLLIADGTDFNNVAMSGDVTITNTGATSISTGVIQNADINASAAIDASKIADGTVSNTEFQYLDNASSNIQNQINNIVAGTVDDVQDSIFNVVDEVDATKKVNFSVGGATTGKTSTITSSHTDNRTVSLPDATDTLVGKATTDTLTNKTIDLGSNTVTTTLAQLNTAVSDATLSNEVLTTQGDIVYRDASANARLAAGTSGYFLKTQGTGADPVWAEVTGGGPSLGTDSVIRTNAKTISENITFAGTENGSSVGPISVASGYTVTVTSGSTWTII